MVACHFGFNETPDSINMKLKTLPENEGFGKGNGLYVHGAINRILPAISEEMHETPLALTNDQISMIRMALDSGALVMVQLDYNPKTLTADTHYVIISGYDLNDENNFTIVDPLGGRVHSLKDYLGWLKPSARNMIEEIYIFRGPQAETKVELEVETKVEAPVETVTPTASVPLPVSAVETSASVSPLPPNYAEIVHGATEWKQAVNSYFPGQQPSSTTFAEMKAKLDSNPLVQIKEVPVATDGSCDQKWSELITYLEIDKVPSEATYEDAKRKVAGFKSAQTDYNNKKLKAEEDLVAERTTVRNLQEDISTLKRKMTEIIKLHKVQIDSLKNTAPTFDKLTKVYEGIVAEANRVAEEKIEEVKKLRIEVNMKEVRDQGGIVIQEAEKLIGKTWFEKIRTILTRAIIIHK